MKDSEASKASEASKSSQASYASIASPQILYYLKSASVAAKSGEPRPGGILAEIPPALGEPRNPLILYYLKSASVAAKSAPRRPGDLLGVPPLKVWGAPKTPHFILPKISFRGADG